MPEESPETPLSTGPGKTLRDEQVTLLTDDRSRETIWVDTSMILRISALCISTIPPACSDFPSCSSVRAMLLKAEARSAPVTRPCRWDPLVAWCEFAVIPRAMLGERSRQNHTTCDVIAFPLLRG